MNIAGLNTRITFQKRTVVVDKYHNHSSDWEDYFSCYATGFYPSGKDQYESDDSVTTYPAEILDFTVRYCSETAAVTTDGYRVLANGKEYNIITIDPMNFKKKSLKFRCMRERR